MATRGGPAAVRDTDGRFSHGRSPGLVGGDSTGNRGAPAVAPLPPPRASCVRRPASPEPRGRLRRCPDRSGCGALGGRYRVPANVSRRASAVAIILAARTVSHPGRRRPVPGFCGGAYGRRRRPETAGRAFSPARRADAGGLLAPRRGEMACRNDSSLAMRPLRGPTAAAGHDRSRVGREWRRPRLIPIRRSGSGFETRPGSATRVASVIAGGCAASGRR